MGFSLPETATSHIHKWDAWIKHQSRITFVSEIQKKTPILFFVIPNNSHDTVNQAKQILLLWYKMYEHWTVQGFPYNNRCCCKREKYLIRWLCWWWRGYTQESMNNWVLIKERRDYLLEREKESKRDRDRKNRTSYVYLPVNTVRNTFSGIGIANVLTTHNECTCWVINVFYFSLLTLFIIYLANYITLFIQIAVNVLMYVRTEALWE